MTIGDAYTIKPGETLGEVAARYGLSVGELLSDPRNAPRSGDPNLIFPGETFYVPLAAGPSGGVTPKPASRTPTPIFVPVPGRVKEAPAPSPTPKPTFGPFTIPPPPDRLVNQEPERERPDVPFLPDWTADIAGWLGDRAGDVVDTVGSIGDEALGSLSRTVGKLLPGLAELVVGLTSTVGDLLGFIGDQMADLDDIGDMLGGAFTPVLGGVVGLAGQILGGGVSALLRGFESVAGATVSDSERDQVERLL